MKLVNRHIIISWIVVLSYWVSTATADLSSDPQPTSTSIRIPRHPVISPDGRRFAFAWQNDIWTASIDGGEATRVTFHAASDHSPRFSPNGKRLYFKSNRSGRDQIHSMPAGGGAAKQITFDSHRKTLHGITNDGRYLLITQNTDRIWTSWEAGRVFLLDTTGAEPKKMLFDAGASSPALSPDGTKVLFTRGYSSWSRKGYQGSQAAQLWLADLSAESPTVTRLSKDRDRFQNIAEMNPMWSADGQGYFFTSDPDGVFNVYYRALDSEETNR